MFIYDIQSTLNVFKADSWNSAGITLAIVDVFADKAKFITIDLYRNINKRKIIDICKADTVAHRFPGLCTPDESYHGVNYYERFGKESMIVETGAEVVLDDPERMAESVRQMEAIAIAARNTEHCHGLFYWNPCCRPRGYMLGAFDMEGRPTEIMRAFTAK